HGPHIRADFVLAMEIAHREILRVYVIAHCDVRGSEADHLSVAAHFLTGAPRVPRHLVAGPDVLPHLDMAARILEHRARGDLLLDDGHIVLGVEHDGDISDGVACHGTSSSATCMRGNLQAARILYKSRPVPSPAEGRGLRGEG